MSEHHLVEDFTTSLSNETITSLLECVLTCRALEGHIRLIHVAFPGVNQRLDIVLVLLNVEAGTGNIAYRAAIACISTRCFAIDVE
jgi:hypothetical protein